MRPSRTVLLCISPVDHPCPYHALITAYTWYYEPVLEFYIRETSLMACARSEMQMGNSWELWAAISGCVWKGYHASLPLDLCWTSIFDYHRDLRISG